MQLFNIVSEDNPQLFEQKFQIDTCMPIKWALELK